MSQQPKPQLDNCQIQKDSFDLNFQLIKQPNNLGSFRIWMLVITSNFLFSQITFEVNAFPFSKFHDSPRSNKNGFPRVDAPISNTLG